MTIVAPEWTVLRITGLGVVPYSTRAATQSLEPIGQAGANIYRDVNGVLRSVGGTTAFQKYRSTISGNDMRPIAVNGVWPGKLVTVQCIATLGYLTATALPARSVVPGSSFIEGDWTFYRPELGMMVLSWSLKEAEYEGAISWSMELEEV